MYNVNNMFKILKRGLENPRFYIEALNIKWKHLILLSLFIALIMGINVTRDLSPILEDIQTNITDSVQFIPSFTIEDQQLVIADEEAAVYYQSEFFQLVIDDQIEGDFSQAGISLPEETASRISTETWVNLIIGQEDAAVAIRGNSQIISLNLNVIGSKENLSQIILTSSQYSFISYSVLLIIGILSAFISYWYIMLLTGLLSGILNYRLNIPIPLPARIKLSIIASFVPILAMELLSFLIPGFSVSYYLIILTTIIILYMTFRNHTFFMQNLMDIMRKQDVKFMSDDNKNGMSLELKNKAQKNKKKNKENRNSSGKDIQSHPEKEEDEK